MTDPPTPPPSPDPRRPRPRERHHRRPDREGSSHREGEPYPPLEQLLAHLPVVLRALCDVPVGRRNHRSGRRVSAGVHHRRGGRRHQPARITLHPALTALSAVARAGQPGLELRRPGPSGSPSVGPLGAPAGLAGSGPFPPLFVCRTLIGNALPHERDSAKPTDTSSFARAPDALREKTPLRSTRSVAFAGSARLGRAAPFQREF